MDDNDDRKAKENDKIYKIIFENKNTRANIRMGINLGIILIIALIVVGVFFNFIIKYKYGDVIEEVKNTKFNKNNMIILVYDLYVLKNSEEVYMLKFMSHGEITESKLITGIQLKDIENTKTITVTQFKGATVVDPNLGNYVVLDFTVTDAAALDINHIILMNNEIPVADSLDKQLRIVKEANKNLKIRLAAQFAGAEHCKFNTTSVNLPYATSFRDGVVRFANVTANYGDTGWFGRKQYSCTERKRC